MNSLPSAKSSLNSESSKEIFNFLRSKKIRKEKVRQEKFNKKIYKRKKIKAKISTQNWKRSASAQFTTKEKSFT